MNISTKLVALALALGATAPAAAVELIINGSFEPGPDYTPAPPATIPGWTTVGDGVEWFTSGTYLPPDFGPAFDGASIVDLAWDPGAAGAFGGIEQTFETIAGQVYTLTFRGVNSISYGRDGSGVVQAFINGTQIAAPTVTQVTQPGWAASDWQTFSYSFTGPGGLTTLTLGNDEDANGSFALIDAVSVQAIPEPATWLMMLLGFAGVGGAMRGRGRAQPVRVRFV